MRIKPFELLYWIFIKPYTFYWVLTAIGVGASLLGGISGKRSADKAAAASIKMGEQNIKMVSEEEKETIRRMDYNYEQVVGQSNAAIAASGLQKGGSNEAYMRGLENNYGNERNWTSKQAQSEKDKIRLDASNQSETLKNQGNTALIGGVASAASWWSGGFNSKPKADGFLKPKKSNINIGLKKPNSGFRLGSTDQLGLGR